MGSVANTDVTSSSDTVAPKRESSLDRYSSSLASTPEGEGTQPADEEAPSAPAPPPKRKGGRKPVSPQAMIFRHLIH
jgi:hypothetical protein